MECNTLRIARQVVAGSQPRLDTSIQAVDIEQRFVDQALRTTDQAGRIIRIKVLGISILLIRQQGKRIRMQGLVRSRASTSATGGQQNDEKHEQRHPVGLCSSLELSG